MRIPENRESSKKNTFFIIVAGLFTLLMLIIPTEFTGSAFRTKTVRTKVRIIEVNNEQLTINGSVRQGKQQLIIKILSGRFKNQMHSILNNMTGKKELDKTFVPGETAFAVIKLSKGGRLSHIQFIDHYRTLKIIFLCIVFIGVTVLIMGWMGVKIITSFIFTVITLVRILYPMILRGWDPIFGALIVTLLITAIFMILMEGLSWRALTAFLGTAGSILLTSILAFVFTGLFKIHGVVRPFTENLFFSGYGINLAHLFIAMIFIAASGAMMNMGMDIAVAMDEIKKQRPALTRKDLMRSGLTVARQAAGAMSTTLLLAYSAEYTALIITFIAQGVPLENAINTIWVSSEMAHTLIGCFGLMLVAPLTVFAGGMLLPEKRQ
jgi:uncharacterized membrane protein